MHNLLAAIFAFLFSFGTVHPSPSAHAFVPPSDSGASFEQAIPSREDLVSGQYQAASYAESVCLNCQTTTDAIFVTR
jgi:hypothetical protein